jgi:hypothetical protein
MFSAALPLSKLLGGDIRSLDMGVRNKEFLGSREERLGNFTVYVSLPPFFILEGVNSPRIWQTVIGQRGKSVFATGLWPDAVKRNEGLLKPNDCRGLNNPRRSVFSI